MELNLTMDRFRRNIDGTMTHLSWGMDQMPCR